MTSRGICAAALAVAVAVLAAAFVPGAAAQTYEVYSCWAGSGTYLNPNASSAAWVLDDARGTKGSGVSYYRAFDECGATDGGMGAMSIPGSEAPDDVYAEARFNSPDGTRIQRVQLWRFAYTYGAGSGTSAQRGYVFDLADGVTFGRGDVFPGTGDASAGSGDATAHGIVPANYLDVGLADVQPMDFSVRVGCSRAPCPTAGHVPGNPTAADTLARIFGAVVTLRDNTKPSLWVERVGLLADGSHAGVEAVTIKVATDISGIKRVAVFADSSAHPVGLADFERDQNHCSWWLRRPCQPVKAFQIPVDTRAVPDGRRTFTVRAYDAAGNTDDHTRTDILVANGGSGRRPAGGGGSGGESTGGGLGSRGSTGNRGSGGGPDVAGEFTARGPVNGVRGSERAKIFAAFVRNGGSRVRVAFGSRPRIRGRLLDRQGRPIANAQIVIEGRLAGSRGRWTDLGSVRTRRSGRFVFRLPRDATSLELRVVYRSHLGQRTITASRKLVLKVSAGVKLTAAPRALRNGQAVTFTGTLRGGPVPRAGKLVDLQVRIGRVWRTFATTRADRDGRFRYRYRFRRTFRSVTYRFRAVSRYELGYPYSSGASRVVRVRVRAAA
jgi:hypothetical protein